jgi:hypothetical protein
LSGIKEIRRAKIGQRDFRRTQELGEERNLEARDRLAGNAGVAGWFVALETIVDTTVLGLTALRQRVIDEPELKRHACVSKIPRTVPEISMSFPSGRHKLLRQVDVP